jgi:hypothetical protein
MCCFETWVCLKNSATTVPETCSSDGSAQAEQRLSADAQADNENTNQHASMTSFAVRSQRSYLEDEERRTVNKARIAPSSMS